MEKNTKQIYIWICIREIYNLVNKYLLMKRPYNGEWTYLLTEIKYKSYICDYMRILWSKKYKFIFFAVGVFFEYFILFNIFNLIWSSFLIRRELDYLCILLIFYLPYGPHVKQLLNPNNPFQWKMISIHEVWDSKAKIESDTGRITAVGFCYYPHY